MATLPITVEDDPERGQDGFALVRLHGMAQHRARDFRLLFSREGTNGCLGPDGWGPRCYAFRPHGVMTDGGDLLLRIGPEIVNPVEEFTLVQLRVPPIAGEALLRWPALQPTADIPVIEIEPDAWESERVVAFDGATEAAAPVVAPAASAPPEAAPPVEPEPEPVVEPQPAPKAADAEGEASAPSGMEGLSVPSRRDRRRAPGADRDRRGPRLWRALLLLALILLLAIAINLRLRQDEPPAPATEEVVEQPLTKEETRLDAAMAAIERGDREMALRLFRANEAAGHAPSMARLATLMDSIDFAPVVTAEPDDAAALDLYARACRGGDRSANPDLRALRDELEARPPEGDAAAELISTRLAEALAACSP